MIGKRQVLNLIQTTTTVGDSNNYAAREFEPMQNLVQDLLNELKNLTNSENYYNRVDSISEINKKSVKHLPATKKCQCKLR